MSTAAARPTVFVSYSHQDEDWKNRLVKQLQVLEFEGALEIWDDRRISAGDDWLPKIEAAMVRSRAAVLLISAAFLTSGFIRQKEVPELLRRREQEGLRVIPVIVHPCPWTAVPWLSKIQARPKDGKPLDSFTKAKAEQHLANLALEIRDLLAGPGARPPGAPATGPGQVDAGVGAVGDRLPGQPGRTVAMPLSVRALFMLLAAAAVLYWITLWEPNHPTVRITDAPCGKRASDDMGMIGGQVEGLSNPQQYKIVIYARTNMWFIQPTETQPLTDVMGNGAWTNFTNPGTFFVALLVEPPYTPRSQTEALPPIGGAVIAKSKIYECPQRKE